MTDKTTPDETPVEPSEGDDQRRSGSRWEPTDPAVDEAAAPESETAAEPPPYVSVPLSFPPGPERERAGTPTRRPRRRLTTIASAAAAALLIGGVGGFTFGLVNGQVDRGSDEAFNHEGFEHHDGFAPAGGDGGHERHAPSTGGDDGADT
ncbi:MAG: hypothetical protein KDB63_10520 [Nocardioidaceae bacterium]|nr:hypothetical protein [Nocardioidaceae bacterium]